jgi:Glycosyl transferase 4-like domain
MTTLPGRDTLVVVSYLAHDPFSPRGTRTRMVLPVIARRWQIQLVAAPPSLLRPPRSGFVAPSRGKLVRSLAQGVLLGKEEPWAVRTFLRWRPTAAAGLLFAAPFGPVVYAAARLRAEGIPYVVDAGDPWVLTEREPTLGAVARLRARRAESRLWRSAAGVVVTTQAQAAELNELFPRLPILVRPSGFDPSSRVQPEAAVAGPAQPSSGHVLRLAHFGTIYEPRLDVAPFLERLAVSRLWDRVEFHQFGSDLVGALRGSAVEVVFHERLPWPEVVGAALAYDAAVVIGNKSGTQLPSKAVDYLLLPVPRIALTPDPLRDALARYVADKSAWLTVDPTAADVPALVAEHVRRAWPPEQLAPPPAEAWESVAAEIDEFLVEVLKPRAARRLA